MIHLLACVAWLQGVPAGAPGPEEVARVAFEEPLEEDVRLRHRLLEGGYALQFARTAELHPVEKVSFIRGLNVWSLLGRGQHGAEEIGRLADTVLRANADLVGLGEGSGELERTRVRFDDTLAVVTYRQVARLADGTRVPVLMGGVRVNVNARGDVAQILNRTFLGVDGLAPARLDEAQAAAAAREAVRGTALEAAGFGAERAAQGFGPLEPNEAKVEELGVFVASEGEPALVYAVLVGARFSTSSGPKYEQRLVMVDAWSGRSLASFPTAMGAQQGAAVACPAPRSKPGGSGSISPLVSTYTETGVIDVYDPNPIENPTYYTLPAYRLDSSFHSLYGPYATVHDGSFGDLVDPNYRFQFISTDPAWPDYYKRADAQAYHQTYKLVTYASRLGFPSLVTAPIYVDAFEVSQVSSAYSFALTQVWLNVGSTQPDADDGDLIAHEYLGHAIDHRIGGLWTYGWPYNHTSESNSALAEGVADYRAASFFNDVELAEVYGQTFPGGYLRILVNDLNISANWSNQRYKDGTIWGSTLWHLRRTLGKAIADRLALQFVYSILPTDTFNSALETAILQADDDLYGGVHEPILRRVFAMTGITGSAGPYDWSSPFPVTPRPYPDAYAATLTHTLPGAAGLAVTFDEFTRVNPADALEVRDGNGTLVGSYSEDELRGQTVLIPGSDTVQLTLNSLPGDTLGGNGFRVVNIAPLGGTPPALTVTSTPAFGMEPQPVTFTVSGSNLVAIELDPGDGSPLCHLDPSHPTLEHVYNRDGIAPIVTPRTFTATIRATNTQGATTTVTRTTRILPYTEGAGAPEHLAAPLSPTSGGTRTCTLTTSGFDCP